MPNTNFSSRAASYTGPAIAVATVTPDDAAPLPGGLTRGLFVGEAGDLLVAGGDGATATIRSAASQYHPIRVLQVLATGTTAGSIVALY